MAKATLSFGQIGLTAVAAGLSLSLLMLPVHAEDRSTETTSYSEAQTKQRLELCQRRQQAVDKRSSGIYQYNAKILEHLNSMLERVQQFVSKQNLTVDNYAGLLSAANEASAEASAALVDIQNGPRLNCSHSNHTAEVASYKERVTKLTQSLKTYRQSLRSLAKAVKAAAKPEVIR